MAKRIKLYSKLSSSEQDNINELIENSELEVIDISASANSKKGVIMTSGEDEVLVVFDILTELSEKSKEVDDDEEEDEELAGELDDEIEIEEEEEEEK